MKIGHGGLLIAALVAAAPAWAAEKITYSYDALGRLVQVGHSGGPVSGTITIYPQDSAWNRTRVQVTGASH